MSANHARSWQHLNPQRTPQKEPKVNVKVRKNGWITKGEKVIYSLVFVSMIISGVFMVSYASTTDTLNREVQTLEQTVNNQKITNEGLVFEKKELSRPERILEIAKEKGLKIQDAEVKQAKSFSN
ncbi:cell division protein FtsL [Oceanobacillus halophilus]|uniref:Cell division protein FtsL n=1 Tax=Oceanobacillus halophilus TaxID=930130 RepID=A0A495AC30_9BACI|nr:cell division protein FtsL [Oceanobacillus halophilus]RKQ37393.1 cell division protein FtsL [Oceanobacillus halophilus]